jgi:hypothetical protein
MLLITFVKLRVVAGTSQMHAGRPHTVSEQPVLIHTCHAMSMLHPCHAVPWIEKWLTEWHGRGMAWVHHGMCESNTATLCKSNEKDTIYTLSGTTWARHGMCELAFTALLTYLPSVCREPQPSVICP